MNTQRQKAIDAFLRAPNSKRKHNYKWTEENGPSFTVSAKPIKIHLLGTQVIRKTWLNSLLFNIKHMFLSARSKVKYFIVKRQIMKTIKSNKNPALYKF